MRDRGSKAAKGGKQMPGDWVCPNAECGDLVFARNNQCRMCGTTRPVERFETRSRAAPEIKKDVPKEAKLPYLNELETFAVIEVWKLEGKDITLVDECYTKATGAALDFQKFGFATFKDALSSIAGLTVSKGEDEVWVSEIVRNHFSQTDRTHSARFKHMMSKYAKMAESKPKVEEEVQQVVPAPVESKGWQCQSCQAWQAQEHQVCFSCGSKPQDPPEKESPVSSIEEKLAASLTSFCEGIVELSAENLKYWIQSNFPELLKQVCPQGDLPTTRLELLTIAQQLAALGGFEAEKAAAPPSMPAPIAPSSLEAVPQLQTPVPQSSPERPVELQTPTDAGREAALLSSQMMKGGMLMPQHLANPGSPAGPPQLAIQTQGLADQSGMIGNFFPAPTWAGAMLGYVFKLGPNGVGYYSDPSLDEKTKEMQAKAPQARVAAIPHYAMPSMPMMFQMPGSPMLLMGSPMHMGMMPMVNGQMGMNMPMGVPMQGVNSPLGVSPLGQGAALGEAGLPVPESLPTPEGATAPATQAPEVGAGTQQQVLVSMNNVFMDAEAEQLAMGYHYEASPDAQMWDNQQAWAWNESQHWAPESRENWDRQRRQPGDRNPSWERNTQSWDRRYDRRNPRYNSWQSSPHRYNDWGSGRQRRVDDGLPTSMDDILRDISPLGSRALRQWITDNALENVLYECGLHPQQPHREMGRDELMQIARERVLEPMFEGVVA
mmetsp:Transcript_39526/g.83589  ORF Transcript_39526/g.83589 Transcript_39526/m.83589 type:complete len:718 (+) Transcript_39526:114-2267(+)